MKVSRLIGEHLKFESLGLEKSFGDGYLVAHNPSYQNIRNQALSLGYKFGSFNEPHLNEAFQTFPLLLLETVLERKVIPFSNNTLPFSFLKESALDVMRFEDLIGNLKQNFVFHEASHAVAREKGLEFLGPIHIGSTLHDHQQFVLRLLLEESFANAQELFATSHVSDQTHRHFYSMNSYMTDFEHRSTLCRMIEIYGQECVLRFLLLCYLQVNFLRDFSHELEFQKILTLSGLSKIDGPNTKLLRALSKVALRLSERFRTQTTDLHLRIRGIGTKMDVLLDFDFWNKFESSIELNGYVSELCAESTMGPSMKTF